MSGWRAIFLSPVCFSIRNSYSIVMRRNKKTYYRENNLKMGGWIWLLILGT